MVPLLKRDLLHAPAFFADQLFELLQQFGADAGGVVGEIDQISFAIFKNLKTEFIAPVMRGEQSVQGLDAALVAFLVACGAQDDGHLLRRMFLVLVLFYQRHIHGLKNRFAAFFGLFQSLRHLPTL